MMEKNGSSIAPTDVCFNLEDFSDTLIPVQANTEVPCTLDLSFPTIVSTSSIPNASPTKSCPSFLPNNDNLICKLCKCGPFSKKNNLNSHLKNTHNVVTTMHPNRKANSELTKIAFKARSLCEECGKQFSTPTRKKRHLDAVHKQVTFCCQFCNRSYSQEYKKKKHALKCSLNPNPVPT